MAPAYHLKNELAEVKPVSKGETSSDYSVAGKILILRLFRLRHIPPALYSTELLAEAGAPVLAVEYGYLRERKVRVPGPFPRMRLEARFARLLPKKLRASAIFLSAFAQLVGKFFHQGRPRLIVAEGIQEECIAFFLHLIFRVPFVAHVHEAYEAKELDKLSRLFHEFGSRVLRYSAFTIFPEQTRAELYQKRYLIHCPIHIVYNCPRLRARPEPINLRQRLNLPANSFLMGYLGGVGKSNAMEEAIMALVELTSTFFLVWGWGDSRYLKTLKSFAREFGVENRVLFLGEVNENKWQHLAGCDVSYCVYRPDLLRLKHAATASNKLMESLAAGVPVITSSEPDFKSIVEAEDVGVCAESISAGDIVHALEKLIPDPAKRRELSENGMRCHQHSYNYEHQFKASLTEIFRVAGFAERNISLKSYNKAGEEAGLRPPFLIETSHVGGHL